LKASAPPRATAPKSPGRTPASPPATRARGRSGEPWRDEPVRAIGATGAEELEGETAEEAEELELEDLSDDEEPEIPLPVEAPVPEEDDSEW
jgi:hypothetical protein